MFDQDVDVFAPCALGAVLNDDTVPRLRAAVVAGAANNQLDAERHGEALRLVDLLQIEGIGRVALQRQKAGAPESDEVVAERLAEGIDERVREKHERQRAHRIGGKEHARIDAHAIGVEQGQLGVVKPAGKGDP